MASTFTRQQADDAVAAARDERDTAPCDLPAAAGTRNGNQQAVLVIGAPRG